MTSWSPTSRNLLSSQIGTELSKLMRNCPKSTTNLAWPACTSYGMSNNVGAGWINSQWIFQHHRVNFLLKILKNLRASSFAEHPLLVCTFNNSNLSLFFFFLIAHSYSSVVIFLVLLIVFGAVGLADLNWYCYSLCCDLWSQKIYGVALIPNISHQLFTQEYPTIC